MLVLTRAVDDTIHIGEKIKITLIKVEGKKVKIGIDAPDNILILRGELKDGSELNKRPS